MAKRRAAPRPGEREKASSGLGWMVVGVLAVLLGLGIRLRAARGDLWFDEILVFGYVQAMRSPLDAILKVHSDNNHALNTMWAYLLGPHRSEVLYRLPAVLAGGVAVLLAGLINAAQSAEDEADHVARRRAFAIGAVLFAASYLMIHYGSEARGYALAIAFAMVGVLAGLRAREWRIGRWTVAYGATMSIAVLAHPLAAHVLIGVATWQAVESFGSRPRTAAGRFFAWQGPPFAFLGLLYWIDFGRMEILGGTQLDPATVLGDASAHTFGSSALSSFGVMVPVIVLAAGLASLILRPASGPSRPRRLWVFYLTSGLVSPALLMATTTDPLIYERYFAVSLSMLLLLLAGALARLARQRVGEAAMVALLIFFILGNISPTENLLEKERGDYRGALAVIAAESRDSLITVGGDHDNRLAPMVDYYGPEIAGPKRRMVYLRQSERTPTSPDWFIWGWENPDEGPPPQLETNSGTRLDLRGRFFYSQLSGFNWAVYRIRYPSEGDES